MLDRLQIIKQRFDEISDLIIQPDVYFWSKRYVQLNQNIRLWSFGRKAYEYDAFALANIEENKWNHDNSDADMTSSQDAASMRIGRLPELEEESVII
jgi:peptide chain release factor 1